MTTRRAFLGLLAGSPAALAATTLKAEEPPQPEPECVYETTSGYVTSDGEVHLLMEGGHPTYSNYAISGLTRCRTHGFNCPGVQR